MNLWILHYSFINHHFHHSTITIKQKIIINKLVTELLWGHFLWKNSCSNEKTSNSAAKRRIPRLKFRGKNPNSAAFRGPRKTVGPSQKVPIHTQSGRYSGLLQWSVIHTFPRNRSRRHSQLGLQHWLGQQPSRSHPSDVGQLSTAHLFEALETRYWFPSQVHYFVTFQD